MATVTALEERELTDEGKQMWKMIQQYEKELEAEPIKPKRKKKLELNVYEVELLSVRLEIKRIIINSKRVIEDCDKIIAKFTTKEEYLASDAKIARMVHLNLIQRMQRVLDGQPAFDFEIEVPKEEENKPNKFYYEPRNT